MEINAVAHLKYWNGESLYNGNERLVIIVKFKERGKLLKTKLEEVLVTTNQIFNSHLYDEDQRIESYDEYYEYIEDVITDKEWLKEVAEQMIKEYFEKKDKSSNDENRRKEISSKVSKIDKLNIIVKIK